MANRQIGLVREPDTGERRQESNTELMLFGPREVVSFLSKRVTFEPGDCVAFGSPANPGLVEPGERVVHAGVTVIGKTHPASDLPRNSSMMYSKNVYELLKHLYDAEARTLKVDFDDEITRECCVTHGGKIVHERVHDAVGT